MNFKKTCLSRALFVTLGATGISMSCASAIADEMPKSGVAAAVEGCGAGHFDCRAPAAVRLVDNERLGVVGGVAVGAAGGAVAGRGTRDGVHPGDAVVEGRRAGHIDRNAPSGTRRSGTGGDRARHATEPKQAEQQEW